MAIQYNGWRGVSDPGASGGSYRVSNVANDKATFKFKGPSIGWVTRKGSDQGFALVTIGGVSKGTTDLYSPATQEFTRTFGSLANASHNIVIKVLNQKDTQAGGYGVALDALVVGATTTQESDCAIQLNTWRCVQNANASGGTYRYSTAAGAIVSLTFTGDNVGWIGQTGPNFGRARVTITNSSVCPPSAPCRIDLYSSAARWQVLIRSFTGLGASQHTIQVQPLHTKSANSNGYRVAVDAFSGPITTMGTSVQVGSQPEDQSTDVSSWLLWLLPFGVVGATSIRRLNQPPK